MGDLAKIGNYWKVVVALTLFFGAARPLNAAELAKSVPPQANLPACSTSQLSQPTVGREPPTGVLSQRSSV